MQTNITISYILYAGIIGARPDGANKPDLKYT